MTRCLVGGVFLSSRRRWKLGIRTERAFSRHHGYVSVNPWKMVDQPCSPKTTQLQTIFRPEAEVEILRAIQFKTILEWNYNLGQSYMNIEAGPAYFFSHMLSFSDIEARLHLE